MNKLDDILLREEELENLSLKDLVLYLEILLELEKEEIEVL